MNCTNGVKTRNEICADPKQRANNALQIAESPRNTLFAKCDQEKVDENEEDASHFLVACRLRKWMSEHRWQIQATHVGVCKNFPAILAFSALSELMTFDLLKR